MELAAEPGDAGVDLHRGYGSIGVAQGGGHIVGFIHEFEFEQGGFANGKEALTECRCS